MELNNEIDFSHFPQARDFLRAVEPLWSAFDRGVFAFVAVVHNGETIILRARLELSLSVANTLMPPVRTSNLSAAQVDLTVGTEVIETCIQRALAGDWLPPVKDQLLKLLPKTTSFQANRFSTYYEVSERSYHRTDRNFERLVISGVNQFEVLSARSWELERELRDVGFDSVSELLRNFGLRGSDETTFDIAVGPVAAIDPCSRLEGCRVILMFSLGKKLPVDRFRCVIKNANPNGVGPLATLSGEDIVWKPDAGLRQGQWIFELPRPGVVDCQVVYAGQIQSEMRLADPTTIPNPRGMMVGLVDPGLRNLERLLSNPGKKDGRNFETAVVWLLQILGFAPIHVGAMSQMTEEPDILALGPGDVVLIVECTTGVPDDNKLTLLISRSIRMRESLSRSLTRGVHSDVVALLVSSLPSQELVGVREKASQHSIIVLCREDLVDAFKRVTHYPDPVAALEHWRGLGLTQLVTTGHVNYE